MELFKDVPTVHAYFMAIYLFLQKKRDKKFSFGLKYHFQQIKFYIVLETYCKYPFVKLQQFEKIYDRLRMTV